MIQKKTLKKLFAVSLIIFCAVFVCTLFISYRIDSGINLENIKDSRLVTLYEAQIAVADMICWTSGICLSLTSMIMLAFYVKQYIDTHQKYLGMMKALGYSTFKIAKQFWFFSISVLFGSSFGFLVAYLFLPQFYKVMNAEISELIEFTPTLHIAVPVFLILVPTVVFGLFSVVYASFKLQKTTMQLLKEMPKQIKHKRVRLKERSFLTELKRTMLASRKSLVFFIGFSAFCFATMIQMTLNMRDMMDELFAILILGIGLILSLVILFISVATVVEGRAKDISIMKVMGYSNTTCRKAVLDGYRPIAWAGFLIGTVYQFVLIKLMTGLFATSIEDFPEVAFDVGACVVTLVAFLAIYETYMYLYAKKIESISVKSVMLV
ncbi:FtsX-like permease family protein [Enterococcus sp. AZ194]|uniref:FtsX-like permease family protein n=1 Tax=Enterococcus sp. AZ194 TaxID=2774629 RepID=UPI003F687E1C